MEERWADIPGFDYQVSDKGRVYSKKTNIIMRQFPMKSGYQQISLRKNGKSYKFLVHRLVLETFCPIDNPQAMEVNHISEDKADNRLENLEWVSPSQNINHGTTRIRCGNGKRKPVLQYDLEGNFIAEYPSAREASEQTGVSHHMISHVCNGHNKTGGGYIWKFKINQ